MMQYFRLVLFRRGATLVDTDQSVTAPDRRTVRAYLEPGDLAWRNPITVVGDSPDPRRQRIWAAEKAVTARWRQEEFELWGDREGRPGALERIDAVVPPEMRQRRHVDLDPRELGTLQFWQDSQRRSRSLRWFRLHYKPIARAETATPMVADTVSPSDGEQPPLSCEEAIRLISNGKMPPLTREDAIRLVTKAGKIPGKNYAWNQLEKDVKRLCGIPDKEKRLGFSHPRLTAVYNGLKDQAK